MYTKKLLNSHWLRKECSSPVIPVQITNGFRLAGKTKKTNQIRAVLTTKFKQMAVVFNKQ